MATVEQLLDLEARQEELLRLLDELDKRVEQTLADCQVYRIRGAEASPKAEAA